MDTKICAMLQEKAPFANPSANIINTTVTNFWSGKRSQKETYSRRQRMVNCHEFKLCKTGSFIQVKKWKSACLLLLPFIHSFILCDAACQTKTVKERAVPLLYLLNAYTYIYRPYRKEEKWLSLPTSVCNMGVAVANKLAGKVKWVCFWCTNESISIWWKLIFYFIFLINLVGFLLMKSYRFTFLLS